MKINLNIICAVILVVFILSGTTGYAAVQSEYNALPPFISSGAPPLVMLVMGKNHKLYYEAYNDASDLDEDGVVDIRYKPDDIDYYGYFDSYKCYEYSSADSRFNPISKTSDKTCTGTGLWSGDFLNYITMSRMDTMRKVLYGGYRSVDSKTATVLERVYIPQDAHSWGKEYTSIAVDGYDISDYTPFSVPTAGLRHLFASTTLDADGDLIGYDDVPLLRYALNNPKRIWKWVAKAAPVVDNSIETTISAHPGHPGSTTDLPDDASAHAEFEDIVNKFANADHLLTPSVIPNTFTTIDSTGTTDFGSNYLAIFTGTINVSVAGNYAIAVDGDDAVEVIIDGGTANEKVVGYYGGHGRCGCTTHQVTMPLTSGTHTFEFRLEEATGSDEFFLHWNGPDSGYSWEIIPAVSTDPVTGLATGIYIDDISTFTLKSLGSTIVDLIARVKVCDPAVGLESNCKQYPDGNYKPIGILQRHGETDRMYFGLMSGTYQNNLQGGVLRKQVGSITDEILTQTTGQFNTATNGIINTINTFRIRDFNYPSGSGGGSYGNCGWITGDLTNGKCRDWGNPVAEMMYETLRYFSGKTTATSNFSGTSADDSMGLPKASFSNPYATHSYCSKPFMLVLSDINPTFDSDNLPGVASAFGSGISDDLPGSGFDAGDIADDISTFEGISGNKFIGQSGLASDGVCSSKNIGGFGDIRGLCPEEPTKKGSYYSASVAYYGHENDLQSFGADKEVKVSTFAVGLASPLPSFEFKLGDPANPQVISLVPFAKTIGNAGTSTAWYNRPTNTIVDFFIESISDTAGVFTINFEDVEQGADHDMDNIVVYTYQLVDGAGNAVASPVDAKAITLTLETIEAAGGYIQHSGYVISGTTKDGTYLEITDKDTSISQDFLVDIDTPPGKDPIGYYAVPPTRDAKGATHNTTIGVLPTKTTRTFWPNSAGAANTAELLKNPLWYAAKWGGFTDSDKNTSDPGYGLPDKQSEWDEDGDNIPDTYFYVTNPLRLEQQLNASFGKILEQAASGTAPSVISNSRTGEGAVYLSTFHPTKNIGTYSLTWSGELNALLIDSYGNLREDSVKDNTLDMWNDYILEYVETALDGIKVNRYADSNGNGEIDAAETVVDQVSPDNLKYLWTSSTWLNSTALDGDITLQRTNYLNLNNRRYIFTWVDANNDGVVDATNEVKDFVAPSLPTDAELVSSSDIYPYLTLYPTFGDKPAAISALPSADFKSFLKAQSQRQINYIRGKDYIDSTGNPEPLSISGSDVSGTEMRPRYFGTGTWRLGDITYSTPTVVGQPAENFHLLYKDQSYAPFVAKYKHRRQMVYAGANDGMLHAFNGGFYDADNVKFWTAYPFADTSGDPPLGAEMWAYVPYNLLPHLYWLTQTTYTEHKHVYYVDQKPRVFDAKIFNPEVECSAKVTDPSYALCHHPNGWGTVMVVGMRFGGGSIIADMDKTDGIVPNPNVDRTMKSAYMIFDITNPEEPPKLLAEIAMPDMGFSTVYPTAFAVNDGDHNGTFDSYNNANPTAGENRWFLVLGSGPADVNGDPGTVSTITGSYDNTILSTAKSMQSAKMYMLDLVKLGQSGSLYSLNSSGALTAGLHVYSEFDASAFLGDPVAVDFQLDYNADNLYFGTVSGTPGNWSGTLRRIIIDDLNDSDNDNDPQNWLWKPTLLKDKTLLMNVGQPVIAGPAVGLDDENRHWVFVGSGRFYTVTDKADLARMSFWGVKEPIDSSSGDKNWNTVSYSDLLNMTDAKVYTSGLVQSSATGANNWDDLLIAQSSAGGWHLEYPLSGERTLGQATLYGGLLTFTSYVPDDDPCQSGGESKLWALYYQSGTAYYSGILGTQADASGDLAISQISLGEGMTTTPSIQTGRSQGSNVLIQSSTGKITKINQKNPLATKSGLRSWRLVD